MNREGPLKPLRHIFHGDAIIVAEPHRHVAPGIGLLVVPRELAHVAAAERDVRILRVNRDVRIFAAGYRKPIAFADRAGIGSAGNRDGGVVLLCPVNAVRLLIVRGHMVELRRGLIALRAPRAAAVQRNRRPAVVPVDQAVRIIRVNPHDVRVAVRHTNGRKRASAVNGAVHREVHDIHGVFVDRIRREAHVIERTHDKLLIAAGPRPRGACIIGAEHAAQ